jgi:sugar/nucleoside kinase (ribokinase family)
MPAPTVSATDRVDALFVGTAFLDIVLAGLDASPAPGQEVWADSRTICPGGMANNAVGSARLGMRTALVSALGDDAFGDLVWDALAAEPGLDLTWTKRVPGLNTPLTVAVTDARDRGLISHGALDPVPAARLAPELPLAAASFVSLHPEPAEWIGPQREAGSTIFAGVGWDEHEGWSGEVLAQLDTVDVFVANEHEALAYTRASTVRDAVRRLAARVPVAAVTLGGRGAIVVDSANGVEIEAPAIDGPVRDTTGAGDEFAVGLMHAALRGLPLADGLRYAVLCAGLSVRGRGGSASAPTSADIAAWFRSTEPKPPGYGFLDAFLATPVTSRPGAAAASLPLDR